MSSSLYNSSFAQQTNNEGTWQHRAISSCCFHGHIFNEIKNQMKLISISSEHGSSCSLIITYIMIGVTFDPVLYIIVLPSLLHHILCKSWSSTEKAGNLTLDKEFSYQQSLWISYQVITWMLLNSDSYLNEIPTFNVQYCTWKKNEVFFFQDQHSIRNCKIMARVKVDINMQILFNSTNGPCILLQN